MGIQFLGERVISKKLRRSESFDVPENISTLAFADTVIKTVAGPDRKSFRNYRIDVDSGEHCCYLTREGWHSLKPRFKSIVDCAITESLAENGNQYKLPEFLVRLGKEISDHSGDNGS